MVFNMSYVELSHNEINEIVDFIYGQIEVLEKIDSSLSELTTEFYALTAEVLETQPSNVQLAIMNAKATLLSSVTTVLSSVSGLIQKLRRIPSVILNALFNFLKIFWKIISRYMNMFKIESITITISMTPSVVVVLKP
ncbi:MAG: hypothetical protein QXT67_09070 [Candidatus Bathyarchaeia archaeon]